MDKLKGIAEGLGIGIAVLIMMAGFIIMILLWAK